MANLTSIIDDNIGWRNSALLVSGIGLLIGLCSFFIEEPVRTNDRGIQIQLVEKE